MISREKETGVQSPLIYQSHYVVQNIDDGSARKRKKATGRDSLARAWIPVFGMGQLIRDEIN